jgi:hypothetical protein
VRQDIVGNRSVSFKLNPILVPIPPNTVRGTFVVRSVLLHCNSETRRSGRRARCQSGLGDYCCQCGYRRRRSPLFRSSRSTRQRRSACGSLWCATATLTTDVYELETKLAKERTFEGVMLFFAAAECAIEISFEQAVPAGCHKSQVISCQPLERVSKLLALLVSCFHCRRGRPKRGGRGNRLRLAANNHKIIHVPGICHDRIYGGFGEVLVLCS